MAVTLGETQWEVINANGLLHFPFVCWCVNVL